LLHQLIQTFNFYQITPLAANLAEDFPFDETSDSLPYSNGENPAAFARTSGDPLEAVKRRRGRPPGLAAVARPKKGPVVEGRRFKRCKAPECPYCFTPDCGACKNCLNPALKSKCVQRKVFFYFLRNLQQVKSRTGPNQASHSLDGFFSNHTLKFLCIACRLFPKSIG
jgi:hypothetical protein